MEEREIAVPTGDGEMTAFTVHPAGDGPFPVAVLFMDGVGYREQIKANARRFAAGGYYVAAPDLYYRKGKGLSFDMSKFGPGMTGPEADRLRAAASSVTTEGMVSDTLALLAAIAGDPAAAPGPRGAVGYCMGARVSLRVAAELTDVFAAAAGIHPGALVTDSPDSPHHDLEKVRGELYFAFAEIDRTATAESVDQFRDEMGRRGVRGEVERLTGTTHGFAMADLPVYDRAAAERHFERTLGLWRRNVRVTS